MKRCLWAIVGAGLLLSCIVVVCCWGPMRDGARAADRARREVEKYAAAERLSPERFRAEGSSREKDGTAVFDYAYQGNPGHLVRIYVHPGGRVEVHRMVE